MNLANFRANVDFSKSSLSSEGISVERSPGESQDEATTRKQQNLAVLLEQNREMFCCRAAKDLLRALDKNMLWVKET